MFSSMRALMHHRLNAAIAAVQRARSPKLDGRALVDTWAVGGVGPRTVAFLVECLKEDEPGVVLECGPGTSTVAMARAAEILGLPTRFVCLEHDEGWASVMRRRLDRAGVAERVTVLTSPLVDRADGARWYGAAAEAAALGPFGFVFIDGPPATDGTARRAPALPAMWDAIEPGALIVLDDARRAGERECLRLWSAQFRGELEARIEPIEKHIAVLRKASRVAAAVEPKARVNEAAAV